MLVTFTIYVHFEIHILLCIYLMAYFCVSIYPFFSLPFLFFPFSHSFSVLLSFFLDYFFIFLFSIFFSFSICRRLCIFITTNKISITTKESKWEEKNCIHLYKIIHIYANNFYNLIFFLIRRFSFVLK